MKCDKLKPLVFSLKDFAYIDEPASEKNFENPHDHAVYKATEVDAAIAELKEFAEDACLERDDNQNAIDELQAENVKLKAANKLLKEHIANGDVSRITWIDEVIELKQKLENVQASMYADVVDANMENRRLRRLLWRAIALFCGRSCEYFNGIMSHCLMGQDDLYKRCEEKKNKYLNAMYKCLAKAEEFK